MHDIVGDLIFLFWLILNNHPTITMHVFFEAYAQLPLLLYIFFLTNVLDIEYRNVSILQKQQATI